MRNLFLVGILIGCGHSSDLSGEYLTDEIVVDFADNTEQSRVDELGKKYGVEFEPASNYTLNDKVYVGHYFGDDEDSVLDGLGNESDVEAADKDEIYRLPEDVLDAHEEYLTIDGIKTTDGFPNDPRRNEQWNMDQIHMPESWNSPTSNGNGVIVSVIDTGVDMRLKDLANTNFIKGYNFVDNNTDTNDPHGHGSHVAGTIAQSTNNGVGVSGVAWKSIIMPLKVLSASGSGSSAGISQAIHYAADHNVEVINMSLGGGAYDKVMARAVKYAHDKGVFVACASGNSARGVVSYPAKYEGAFAVGATQKDELITPYSNWGKEIFVAAPGGNTRGNPSGGILQNTTFKGKEDYYFLQGTSMASPHVAGLAATLISEGVNNPDEVAKIIQKTARVPRGMSKDAKWFKQHYGAGIIDVAAAVKMARGGAVLPTTHRIGLFILVLVVFFIVLVYIKRKRK